MNKKNVIVLHCHDLGDYLGCYGTPVHTPYIDQIAREGVLLSNHFASAAVCSPSRGSMWTGCYPHTHGLMGLVPRGWEMDVEKCPTLMSFLQEAGYQTLLFGLQHEHWNPLRLGYQKVFGQQPYYCEEVTQDLLDWLNSGKPKDMPFFASVGFFDPHRIGLASQGFTKENLGQLPSHFKRPVYQPASPAEVEVRHYLPDIPPQREELADFYGAVRLVDEMVGRITKALRETSLDRDTLLIFTTDHGASFLHSKGTLYDGGVKVCCLLRFPGVLPEGHQVDALTSHVDLSSTILDLLGYETGLGESGRSFTGVLRDKTDHHREYVFAERNYTQYFDPSRMVRSKKYKYIRNGLRKCIFDFVITEIEMSQASFRNNKEVFSFYDSRRVLEELYDIEADPGEMVNLVGDPAYVSTLESLRSVLQEHLEVTHDPFLNFRNELLMPEDVYANIKGITKKKQKRSAEVKND
jgi:N-sulfoglucosamine sulfohydrolase